MFEAALLGDANAAVGKAVGKAVGWLEALGWKVAEGEGEALGW